MKGFTLVEMLGAAVLLTMIVMIALPIVNDVLNQSREKAYQAQISKIKYAASNFAAENPKLMPKQNEAVTIYLWTLKKSGYIEESFVNQKIEEEFNEDLEILIENTKTGYKYTVLENSGKKETEYDKNKPIIIMNSKSQLQVEIASLFKDPGLIILNNEEKVPYTAKYYENGAEVQEISTENEKTYLIKYNFTVNTTNYEISRIVKIKDTIPPTIKFIDGLDEYENRGFVIDIGDTEDFNSAIQELNERVSVSDNSKKETSLLISGSIENAVGEYNILFTATDFYKNKSSKILTVRVIDEASDTTAPTMTFSRENGTEPKKNYSIKVTATDTQTGVKEIFYAWGDNNTAPTTEMQTLTSSIETIITPNNLNGNYYLFIVAIDYANNQNPQIVGPFLLDNEAPDIGTLSINATANETGCPTFTITASGNGSDINGLNPNYYFRVGFDKEILKSQGMVANSYNDYTYITKCTKTDQTCLVSGRDIKGKTTYPYQVCILDLAGNMTCTNTKTISTNSDEASWDCQY